jgi:hypothetical protein
MSAFSRVLVPIDFGTESKAVLRIPPSATFRPAWECREPNGYHPRRCTFAAGRRDCSTAGHNLAMSVGCSEE